MRPHYSTAPAQLQEQAEKMRQLHLQDTPAGARYVWCEFWMSHDYAVAREDVAEEIKLAEEKRDAVRRGDFLKIRELTAVGRTFELAQSERLLARLPSLLRWASEESSAEKREKQRLEAERLERERRIDERARAILEADAAKALAKAKERARKELEGHE